MLQTLFGLNPKYQYGSKIGKGGFGTVYSGTRIQDHLPVAIKYILNTNVCHWNFVNGRKVPREVSILKKVQHVSGVVKLLDYYENPDAWLLVLDKPEECQDLYDFISENGPLQEDLARNFFHQVVQCIVECYQSGVFHGDIKDENILVDLKTLKLTLIDFGGATLHRYSSRIFLARCHVPPEWIQECINDSYATTIWTLGLLLFDMVCGNYPFQKDQEILEAKLEFVDTVSEDCKDLIQKCMMVKPSQRLTLEEILNHKWMM